MIVTLRDAVRTTREDTRSPAEDRSDRLRRMCAWAVASIQSHAASSRALERLTDDARSSGAVTAAEAKILAELAAESERGLTDAHRELAAIPEQEMDGAPAALATPQTTGADENAGEAARPRITR